MQLPSRVCPCICRGLLHIVERCAALYLAQVGGFEPPRLLGQKGDRPRAILGGIARKSSQLPKHLRIKPEGGVVTTRAGIAFAECVTVALPTQHISPELSPGIFDGAGNGKHRRNRLRMEPTPSILLYFSKVGTSCPHFTALHTLAFCRGTPPA